MGLEKLKKSAVLRKKQRTVLAVVFAACIILNLAARASSGFAQFYRQKVFPKISAPFAWLTSRLPFSVGEILIFAAVILIPLSIAAFIVLMIVMRKNRDKKRKIRRVYGYVFAWIIAYILLTETLNCFMLYQTPTFAETYGYPQEKYTPSQLEELAEFLIAETNELSYQVERDDNGEFVLTADLDETAWAAMRSLSDKYPQLSGYYASPKAIKYSYFMSQQYTMGIYFPFTMEANYNDEMYSLNLPDTVCHELAHTKGFMREDEANFVGFLACDASDSTDYRYSGYLRAMKYVLSKCGENCSEDTVNALYAKLSDGVRTDWNANSGYWQSVQESDEGLISSKTVAEVSDKAMETSLKINGVEDGKKSYGRMVDLLLDWYFDINTEETSE